MIKARETECSFLVCRESIVILAAKGISWESRKHRDGIRHDVDTVRAQECVQFELTRRVYFGTSAIM